MLNVRVGHYTNTQNKTGVSVFLFEQSARAVYLLCGSAPASRDLHVLEPGSIVENIHGLAFTGGSAFGLDAVAGVMKYLHEQDRGFKTPAINIPIVPAAAIYDFTLAVAPPVADDMYQACVAAIPNNQASGRVGAGTSASIGKFVAGAKSMSGGFGWATIELANNVLVTAYVVVNCLGDVRDRSGNIVAGACLPNGEFADTEKFLLSQSIEPNHPFLSAFNTTLVAVMTNANFNKAELLRIARVASSGMARAISPVFTRYDGDLLFALSVGELSASEDKVSVAAAESVRLAILAAVKDSVVVD